MVSDLFSREKRIDTVGGLRRRAAGLRCTPPLAPVFSPTLITGRTLLGPVLAKVHPDLPRSQETHRIDAAMGICRLTANTGCYPHPASEDKATRLRKPEEMALLRPRCCIDGAPNQAAIVTKTCFPAGLYYQAVSPSAAGGGRRSQPASSVFTLFGYHGRPSAVLSEPTGTHTLLDQGDLTGNGQGAALP